MKKIIISVFLCFSFLIFGVEDEKKIDSDLTEIQNIQNGESDNDSEVAENGIGIVEYRPAILVELDNKIANPTNRWAIPQLMNEYEKELMNYLESIEYDETRIFLLANEYMLLNNYERANKIFMLGKDFKNIFGAATTFRFMGKNEEAIQKYSQAISRDSSFAESYLGRGLANRNLDNYESAINDIKKYISLSGREEGYVALSDIYFRLKKYDDAYTYVSKGLSRYPSSNILKKLGDNIRKNRSSQK